MITTSWQGASVTTRGAIGLAIASTQVRPISSSGLPKPMR